MRILIPSDIRSHPGASGEIAAVLTGLGGTKPLIVVDPVVFKLNLCAAALEDLEAKGFEPVICTDVSPDPTIDEALAAANMAREAEADCVIGIGGGSAMDIAKVAALLATHDGDIRSFAVPRIVDEVALPIVCIPTTAGTGSEVTRAAVITDAVTHEKLLLLGKALLPQAAILDVDLTMSCPFRVTVDSGLDALSHALESLVNRHATPFSDGIAFEALRLLGTHLETAAFSPDDRTARQGMLDGAMLAGIAVSHTSTALIHGMSRPIGAAFQVPHGMSNAMLMPLITEWSLTAAPERYARAAQALGAGEAGQDLVEKLKSLNASLQVPRLRDRGFAQEAFLAAIPEMTRQALASGTPDNNPRLGSAEDIAALYHELWDKA
ncbi:iron-containing alcohol dehydrogenase [Celeribacter sp. ULVN23_4]